MFPPGAPGGCTNAIPRFRRTKNMTMQSYNPNMRWYERAIAWLNRHGW
jgi:hypothetical protein